MKEIVSVNRENVDLVYGLFNLYRVFYGKEPDLALAQKYIDDRVQQADSLIFVVMEKGKPVGFTQLYPSFSSVRLVKNWIINDLYVVQECRSQGVGTLLLEHAFREAKERGAKAVLISTQRTNQPARCLYQYLGFREKEDSAEFVDYRLELDPA
ncbi:GNAT family N-acetyltransferase [Sphingobacterium haloxyli]|uniref:GNAT family N-acetyltransferase n=1 Tax=Sphingobacterium haloxyli TaxID=2100533 RepID=A0A2S9IYB0_9SPHI|nr:GNAT family N-acetyltransferase [Sphingobacterium haloxyli]PRD45513.1 GNAT family N-acetyltransferase [Sphingobacterium haloxyli]